MTPHPATIYSVIAPPPRSGLVQGDIIMFEEYEPALASWRQWYEDIKSGRRTFRFEGDSTEYDLNGPAPKEKLERIARDRKRDSEHEAGQKKTADSSAVETLTTPFASSSSMSVAIFITCTVLLVSLVWYFLKARSRRDP